MGGKRNPHTLLVGMEVSTTTTENSMEALQKAKNGIVILFRNSTPRDILQET
jgi:tRNA G46 methylase TrmB